MIYAGSKADGTLRFWAKTSVYTIEAKEVDQSLRFGNCGHFLVVTGSRVSHHKISMKYDAGRAQQQMRLSVSNSCDEQDWPEKL